MPLEHIFWLQSAIIPTHFSPFVFTASSSLHHHIYSLILSKPNKTHQPHYPSSQTIPSNLYKAHFLPISTLYPHLLSSLQTFFHANPFSLIPCMLLPLWDPTSSSLHTQPATPFSHYIPHAHHLRLYLPIIATVHSHSPYPYYYALDAHSPISLTRFFIDPTRLFFTPSWHKWPMHACLFNFFQKPFVKAFHL